MPKRGEAATPAQRAALERGQKSRLEKLATHQPGDDRQKDRWKKLLDGTITVKDLDDEEVARMRVKGKGGTFSGKMPVMPSHLAQQFHAENIARANNRFRTSAVKAVKGLIKIAEDPDASDANRIKAYAMILDRALGKTPETIRVEGMGAFDKMMSDAIGLDRSGMDVPDDASSIDG